MFVEMMKQLKMITLVIMKLRSVCMGPGRTKVSLWIRRNFGESSPGKSLAKDAISIEV